MNPASDWKRLYAALMISCLLHVALFFLPYLGVGSDVSRPSVPGGRKPEPARGLDLTLALESGAATVTAIPAEAASVAAPQSERRASEAPRPALDHALGIALLPMPAPSYYTTDQLTQRPRPIADPKLDVPEITPVFTSGTLVLKLWIDELGDVIAVDVEKTELPDAVSSSAVAAFRNLHFVPGEINGRRVGTLMRIEVVYNDGTRPLP